MSDRNPHDRRPHLFRRPGSSVYQLAFYVPGQVAPIRVSTKTTDPDVAERIRAAKEAELGAAALGYTTVALPAQATLTVGACLDLIEADYVMTGRRSWATTQYHVRRAREAFGSLRALDLSTAVVKRQVRLWLAAKVRPATINRRLATLFRGLELAVEDKLLPRMPDCRIAMLDEDNVKVGFFERAEYEGLRAALSEDDLRDALDWGYYTGWRIDEVRSLTWASFNRETWELRLESRDSKNKQLRTIPCVGPLRAILDRRWKARRLGCPFVFHRSGANLGDFGKTWAAAWEAAKLPLYPAPTAEDSERVAPRTFHDLRRTAARNLIRAGVDRKTAKLITGHRTDSIFDRYDIKRPEDVADALIRVGAYVATLPACTADAATRSTVG